MAPSGGWHGSSQPSDYTESRLGQTDLQAENSGAWGMDVSPQFGLLSVLGRDSEPESQPIK